MECERQSKPNARRCVNCIRRQIGGSAIIIGLLVGEHWWPSGYCSCSCSCWRCCLVCALPPNLKRSLALRRQDKKQCVHTVFNSGRVIACAKMGKDAFVDDFLGNVIRQNTLKPTAYLDADFMFVRSNQEKRAITFLGCEDTPISSEPITIFLNAVA